MKMNDDYYDDLSSVGMLDIITDILKNGIEGINRKYSFPFEASNKDLYEYGILRGQFDLDFDNLDGTLYLVRVDVKDKRMLEKALKRGLGNRNENKYESEKFRENICNQVNQIYNKYCDNEQDDFIFKVYLDDPFAKIITVEKYEKELNEYGGVYIRKTCFDIDFVKGEVQKVVFFKEEEVSREIFVDEDFKFEKEK